MPETPPVTTATRPAKRPAIAASLALAERRGLWIVLPVGAALLVAWLRLWSPVPVQVVRLDRGTVTQEAFGRGTIESQREAAVGFDLVGRLSEVRPAHQKRLRPSDGTEDG